MEKRTALRALGAPTPVRVRTDGRGRPLAVVVPDPRGRRSMGEPQLIEAVRESWRIDDEWWRRPISRIYHQVVLETGAILTLYQDLEEGGWYIHGGAGSGGPRRPRTSFSRRTRARGDG